MSKIWVDYEHIVPGGGVVHGGSYSVVPRCGETVEVNNTVYTVLAVLYLIEHGEMTAIVRLK